MTAILAGLNIMALLLFAGEGFAASKVISSSKIEEGTISQVFTTTEGGHKFIAYGVERNGTTVIVSDILCRSDLPVGAKIKYSVHKSKTEEAGGFSKIGFSLIREVSRGSDSRSAAEQDRGMRIARGDLTAARNDQERFFALGPAAKKALDAGKTEEARKLATELEKWISVYPNNGNAIQNANQVLGRIALAAGEIEEAERRLIASAESKGSPQMNTFGPNMQLAKGLLEKGGREVVIEYFKRCRKFWEMGQEKLDLWTEEAEAGKVPDFGANLLY